MITGCWSLAASVNVVPRRAILREPQVLILDEATSALDSKNERRIQAAIDGLHEQITIIVITHRLSTLRNADQICVLEQGRVKETGTWQSLTSNTASRFHTIWRTLRMST